MPNWPFPLATMATQNYGTIWLKDNVAEENLARFCEITKGRLFDHGLRAKFYVDGPVGSYDWVIATCTNIGLLSGLVFASTFASAFNTDILGTISGDKSHLAGACIVNVVSAVTLSAVSLALCILVLTQAQQVSRKETADVLAMLSFYFNFVILAVVLVAGGVITALISIMFWLFLSYSEGLAATLTGCMCVFIVLLLVLLFRFVVKMYLRVASFERLVLTRKYDEAWRSLLSDSAQPDVMEASLLVRKPASAIVP